MTIKPISLGLDKLLQKKRFRERFISTSARDQIASQIRQLRLKRGFKTQTEFAKAAKMQQSAVSRIEQAEYSSWTFRTLLKVAFALKARLRITFEPIEASVAVMKRSEDAAALHDQTSSDVTEPPAEAAEYHGMVLVPDSWDNTSATGVVQ